MRWTTVARAVIAASALAVAVALVVAERDRDGCEQATGIAFLAAPGTESQLAPHVDEVIQECSGSDPLNRVAVGLRVKRPRAATRLAREAARREPESYTAWAVLSVAAPPAEARRAARRARALNPISASAAGP